MSLRTAWITALDSLIWYLFYNFHCISINEAVNGSCLASKCWDNCRGAICQEHTNGISLMCYKMFFFFSVQFNTTICILLAADMLCHTINKLILVKKSVDRIMNFMQSGHFMIGSFYDTWVHKGVFLSIRYWLRKVFVKQLLRLF